MCEPQARAHKGLMCACMCRCCRTSISKERKGRTNIRWPTRSDRAGGRGSFNRRSAAASASAAAAAVCTAAIATACCRSQRMLLLHLTILIRARTHCVHTQIHIPELSLSHTKTHIHIQTVTHTQSSLDGWAAAAEAAGGVGGKESAFISHDDKFSAPGVCVCVCVCVFLFCWHSVYWTVKIRASCKYGCVYSVVVLTFNHLSPYLYISIFPLYFFMFLFSTYVFSEFPKYVLGISDPEVRRACVRESERERERGE